MSDINLGPETTMQQALELYPGAQGVLFEKFHIGGCETCGYRPAETIREVCTRFALKEDEVIATIHNAPAIQRRFSGPEIALTSVSPKNEGAMPDADAVGRVGNAECGELMTLWLKFKHDHGRRVIERASFETFGCETAIVLATRLTEALRGKTPEQALAMRRDEYTGEMGPLPPVKIHCAELVEAALRSALTASNASDSVSDKARKR